MDCFADCVIGVGWCEIDVNLVLMSLYVAVFVWFALVLLFCMCCKVCWFVVGVLCFLCGVSKLLVSVDVL